MFLSFLIVLSGMQCDFFAGMELDHAMNTVLSGTQNETFIGRNQMSAAGLRQNMGIKVKSYEEFI